MPKKIKIKKEIISKRVNSISKSGIRKFFDMTLEMEDVISLGVGEPDFVTPWQIREACIFSLERGYTSYTSNWGLYELRDLISQKLNKGYKLEYNPKDEVLITAGVSEGLDLAIRAIINPGEEVIISEPCYVSYLPCITFAGGIAVPISTDISSEFKPTPEQINESISDKTKALIISHPNNPTGSTMSKKELEGIADVVNEHDLIVISDEIYEELTYEGKHTCFSSLNGMRDRTILLNGLSKAYAMTGWRVGFVAGNADIIEAMMKIHQYTMLCAPITGQFAAIEALKSCDEAVKEMVADYDRRRRLMVEGLDKIGLECIKPKGAFYTFPSIKTTGLSSEEFTEGLLNEKKVAVVPGNVFGASGEGFIRCAYAVSKDVLKEALSRIKSFVEDNR